MHAVLLGIVYKNIVIAIVIATIIVIVDCRCHGNCHCTPNCAFYGPLFFLSLHPSPFAVSHLVSNFVLKLLQKMNTFLIIICQHIRRVRGMDG